MVEPGTSIWREFSQEDRSWMSEINDLNSWNVEQLFQFRRSTRLEVFVSLCSEPGWDGDFTVTTDCCDLSNQPEEELPGLNDGCTGTTDSRDLSSQAEEELPDRKEPSISLLGQQETVKRPWVGKMIELFWPDLMERYEERYGMHNGSDREGGGEETEEDNLVASVN